MYSTLPTSIYNTGYHSYGFYYRLRPNKSMSIYFKQFCIADVINDCYSIHSSAPPPKVSISPPGGTPTAGETFSLTCSVTLQDGGPLTEDLIVQWEAPVDISMDDKIQVVTGDSTGTRTSVLQFTPVLTSHGGQYTCKATTTTGADMATATLTVQSEKLINLA